MNDGTENQLLFDHHDDQYHFDNDFLLEPNFLDEAALSEFLAPPAEKWSDVNHSSVKTKVTVDESKVHASVTFVTTKMLVRYS